VEAVGGKKNALVKTAAAYVLLNKNGPPERSCKQEGRDTDNLRGKNRGGGSLRGWAAPCPGRLGGALGCPKKGGGRKKLEKRVISAYIAEEMRARQSSRTAGGRETTSKSCRSFDRLLDLQRI